MAKSVFKLSIVGAGEDVPRLITASGRSCGGEFGLVLRPQQDRGVLVLDLGKQGVLRWAAKGVGVPQIPSESISLAEGVAALTDARADLEPEGPVTLRGEWSGTVHCDADGAPIVTLARKIASYGTLTLQSLPGKAGIGHWLVQVDRAERWYGQKAQQTEQAATLRKAFDRGYSMMRTKVAEACTTRDTTRRAARDQAYAAEHPIRTSRGAKDTLTPMVERQQKRAEDVPVAYYLTGILGHEAWTLPLSKNKAEKHLARLQAAGRHVQLLTVKGGGTQEATLKLVASQLRAVTSVKLAESVGALEKAITPPASEPASAGRTSRTQGAKPSPSPARDGSATTNKPSRGSRRDGSAGTSRGGRTGDAKPSPRTSRDASPPAAPRPPRGAKAGDAQDAVLLDLFNQAMKAAAGAAA